MTTEAFKTPAYPFKTPAYSFKMATDTVRKATEGIQDYFYTFNCPSLIQFSVY